MAKQQTRKLDPAAPSVFDEEAGTVATLEPAAAPVAAVLATPPPPPTPGLFHVALACPTPLKYQGMDIEAESESEAQAKFDAANGISGSDHTYTVTRL